MAIGGTRLFEDEHSVICLWAERSCHRGLLLQERRSNDRSGRQKTINKRFDMKLKITLGLLVAGLVLAAAPASLLAQNGPGPGPKGNGYGGPPQTEQERAARQAACLEKNGGVCPNGGPQKACPGGMGQGRGAGKGWGKGLRDGTGPRAGNGTCPLASPKAGTK
jgi:hypothetical protein